ncbi:hypothetical protein GCM10009606_47380 [Nocardioides aquiterrae]|uniref:PKD domain-containing protein n=1 Tax=Nocardioides aquiterrae TaxID=203799 RepID=A0ABN1URR3_9ACTN
MIRLVAALALGIALAVLPAPSATAACHVVRQEEWVNGQLHIYWVKHCESSSQTGTTPVGTLPPRDSGWDAACVRTAITLGVDPATFCDVPPGAAPPSVTPGLVARALRRIDLPASELSVQPPNGRTLVNFDTNFYTENGEFTRTVTLLGQRVELRIWPARYGWRFGDGQQRWTTTPGDAYPHLEVTHRYLRKGRVSPSVDTTYAAQFRVNGGPWRDVNGTVTIPGTPQRLRVVTARPVLVGG